MSALGRKNDHLNYYRRLKGTIFVFFLLVACIPLPIVAGTIYRYYRIYVRSTVEQNLKGVVEKRRVAIEVFLAERVAFLKTISHWRGLDPAKGPESMKQLFAIVKPNSPSFVDIGMIDAGGRQVTYIGPYDLKGKDYSQTVWFKEVRRKGVYISDIFLGYRNIPHLAIAVRGPGREDTWYLRATINTDTLKRLMGAEQVSVIRHAYLFKGGDSLQLHLGSGMRIDPATLIKPPPGKIAVSSVSTMKDRRMLAAIGWLNQNRWLLMVAENPASEFVSLDQARRVGLLLFFSTVIIVGIVTYLTAQWIVRKIQLADRQRDLIQEHLARTSKLVALGKMAAGLAHEINNPLAIISESAGYAKEVMDMAAAKGQVLSREQRKEIYTSLQDITGEAFRGKDITQRLLGFARGQDAQIVEVNVNRLAGDLLKSYARILAKTGKVRLQERFELGLPIIKTDPGQLQQVLINLIDNAIYFTSQKGGRVTVGTYSRPGLVEIKVRDNGPGMNASAREKIFDPFYTTKPVGQGIGLGLAICYGIVKKLGGEIYVQSEEGQGAVFTIQLPVSPTSKEVPK